MKKTATLFIGALVLAGCGDKGPEKATLETDIQKASYSIGFTMGEQMNGRLDDIELDAFLTGMRHGAMGDDATPQMSPEEIETAIQTYQQQKMEEAEAAILKEAEDNASAGQAYRDENAAREEVTVTESGLQYEVMASGEDGAASPSLDDEVVVHYHGTLTDGTVFDSSVDRGQPATFPLGGIIKGWQEAMTMMKVGDKWRIVLPPELAYGERGAGSVIGPNQTLVFEVELLEINAAATGE